MPIAKVFHVGDVPDRVLKSKQDVQKSKQTNVLGTHKDPWNPSVEKEPRLAKTTGSLKYGGGSQLRRTLQKVF